MREKSNYKIIDLVDKGQFGKVFVAIEGNDGTLVALKELNQKQLSSSSFWQELHFLVTLNHFNIVTYKTLEHYQNHCYIVMDYYEGGTLRNLLDSSFKLTLDQSLKLVINILSGLRFAHEKAIIHRNIKPENILLKISDRQPWTAHISNFGMAKLYQEISNKINLGNTGNPAYMAPEQFYGQYSYSCDLYAVGAILFELIVGEPPFSGMPQELMSAHLNQPVIIPKTIPFIVRSLLAKSLQKLPHRRFLNAGEMLQSLQSAQELLQVDDYTITLSQTTLSQTEQCFYCLTPSSTEVLVDPVTHLAIATEQVYLGTLDRLYIRRYRDLSLAGEMVNQWEVSLDQKIRSLQIRSDGCFITTASSLYYLPQDTTTEEFRFFSATLLPIASFPTTKLVSTIDPQGSWLGVSYIPHKSKTPAWEIFRLPNCQLKRSQINRQPWKYLIALDRRYGLGIHNTKQQTTELHLFDRRGNWLANYLIQVQLNLVTYNPLFPWQLLATEANKPNVAILITLKRFQVQRIPLENNPVLLTNCQFGYLLSDRWGTITLIKGDDLSLTQFQVPLPTEFEVTAIAMTATQILVASASPSQAQLQRFSWDY